MSSTEQMKVVLRLASQHLEAAAKAESVRPDVNPPNAVTVVGIAYARGVLDLLTAYLVVTEPGEDEAPEAAPTMPVQDKP